MRTKTLLFFLVSFFIVCTTFANADIITESEKLKRWQSGGEQAISLCKPNKVSVVTAAKLILVAVIDENGHVKVSGYDVECRFAKKNFLTTTTE